MRNSSAPFLAAFLLFPIAAPALSAAGKDNGKNAPLPLQTCLFDTGTPAAQPLTAAVLAKRAGWHQIPEGQTAHDSKGDVVFQNNRLTVVLRKHSPGAEVYARTKNGIKRYAVLAPLGEDGGGKLASVKIFRNSLNGVAVDAAFQAANGKQLTLRLSLGVGQVYVKTQARQDVTRLRVEAPSRFAILPDFFAEDMLFDAAKIPVSRTEVPSENFFLQFVGGGEAIIASIWRDSGEDIEISLAGKGQDKVITATEIQYGKEGLVWVALMACQDVWHVRETTKKEIEEMTQCGQKSMTVALPWKAPFAAMWRVTCTLKGNRPDSWDLAVEVLGQGYKWRPYKEAQEGSYSPVPSPALAPAFAKWFRDYRHFYINVSAKYCINLSRDGQGFLKIDNRHLGPAILYPIGRTASTPPDVFTLPDLMRATLGVGPCAYILDLEARKSQFKGLYTCGARDILNKIYSKKQQRSQKAQIEQTLKEVVVFISHMRGRIDAYVKFSRELREYLAARKKEQPEIAEFISRMEGIARSVDRDFERRKTTIKTPVFAAELAEKFRDTLIGYEGKDALEKCKRFTSAWTKIGGTQDGMVGRYRTCARRLRLEAGMAMMLNPKVAKVAKEIRNRARKVMRNPSVYEIWHNK